VFCWVVRSVYEVRLVEEGATASHLHLRLLIMHHSFTTTTFTPASNSSKRSTAKPPPTCRGTISGVVPRKSLHMERKIQQLMTFRFGPEMVTIRVGLGDNTHIFPVYENVICKSSKFIQNALKGDCRDAEYRMVQLPEFPSDDFEVYHVWLLTGRLHSKDGDTFYDPDGSAQAVKMYETSLWWEMAKLGNLSHLGHYLLDTDFTDAVSDAMIQCMIELQTLKRAFPVEKGPSMIAKLPEASPTRTLIFELVAWTTSEAQMQQICDQQREHPTEKQYLDFMIGVSMALASRFTSPTPTMSPLEGWKSPGTVCKYHSHGEEKACYLKTKMI
jgi:hypothetical protein